MKISKHDDGLHIVDESLGINCEYIDEKIKGKGSRLYKTEITEAITEFNTSSEFTDKHKQELFTLAEVCSTWGTSTSYDAVLIADLYKWLSNPMKFNKEIRNLCLYWYGEKGVVTETIELYKSLPNLNASIQSDKADEKITAKYSPIIKKMDRYLSQKNTIRDIIFHTAIDGTCLGYVHRKKYIQLLDLDCYYPIRIVNGKWQIAVDLRLLSDTTSVYSRSRTKKCSISEQPLEVQRAWEKYTDAKKEASGKGSRISSVYTLNPKNTFAIKIRSKQNERYGRPVPMGALTSLLHKELLTLAEKATIDRLVNTILIAQYGEEGKDGYHPSKDQSKLVHGQIKDVLTSPSKSGIKLIGVPYWTDISDLKVELDVFGEDKYIEVDNDINVALGVSSMFTHGQSTFASGKINLELLYSHIFEILEQIEENLFNYQFNLVTDDVIFTKKYSRAVLLDIDAKLKYINTLVDKGGSLKTLTDELSIDFETWVKQTKYEQDTLDLHSILEPYQTSNQISPDGEDSSSGENDGSNDTPRPDV